jgi:hypothetical protein
VNQLTIILNAQGWHLRFEEGHEDRATMLHLFGTDTIPLPYTARANASQIVENLRKNYPGSEIKIEPRYTWTEVPGEVS